MTHFVDMTTKCVILVYCFLASFLLNDAMVFGVLSSDFFAYTSILYGFMGNMFYSLVILFTEWRRKADDDITRKPLNRYGYILLFAQPFGASFFSFVLTAIIKTLVSDGGFINWKVDEGGSLLIGILSGLFFVYFSRPEVIEKLYKRYGEPAIFPKQPKK